MFIDCLQVAYQDYASCLVCSRSSLEAISTGREQLYEMQRFRPNLVIDGPLKAWEEVRFYILY